MNDFQKKVFKQNAEYYQESDKGYIICKNAGCYFASNEKKEFIGGPFDDVYKARQFCEKHYKQRTKLKEVS